MDQRIVIDLSEIYSGTAKLSDLDSFVERARKMAGEGNVILLTGQAPIWMYLKISHALHGKAKQLYYSSPSVGEILIFDHNAF